MCSASVQPVPKKSNPIPSSRAYARDLQTARPIADSSPIPVRNDAEGDVDRLSHAKKFANELSDSRLREIKISYKRRWPPEKRAAKAQWIQTRKPWEASTGPKTEAGKQESRANACKHRCVRGGDEKLAFLWLRLQKTFIRYVELVHIKGLGYKTRDRLMTLEKLLLKMREDLKAAGVLTAALDARILARQGGNFSDSDLITKAMCPLSPEVIEKTLQLLSRRLVGEPVSRILGEKEFWGLSFKVSPDTLDPRPDTETLIEAALKKLRNQPPSMSSQAKLRDLRILDLGTGTGCILISLLKELPNATGVAVDINPGAIAVARENAIRHGVDARIEFRQGSWLDPVKEGESFDLIVSNPPYIPESEIESLSKEVRNHDPILALSGGLDGLDAYKIILMGIKKHLACDGFTLLEIGKGQEKDLARLVDESNMRVCDSYFDLAGILRVVEISHGEN